jgi:hypothetical protein
MAVENTPRRAGPFVSNGTTTAFAFTFRVFKADEVGVTVSSSTEGTAIDSPLTYLNDYTVTLNADQENNPGGTVTLLTAPASGIRITILSVVEATQETQLTNHDGLSPKILNTVHDKLTILIQQLQEKADRTVVVPASSTKTPDQLLTEILEVADSANDFAQQTKAIYDDVVIRHAEIDAVKDHVDEQAAKVDGAVGAIEGARDEAVAAVEAEGDKVKGEVGDLVATASAIADRVSADATTATTASQSASQSAEQAIGAQYQALQSEQVALQAALDAAEVAQSAGFGFRFSYSAQEYQEIAIDLLIPNALAKVGDHVVNADGAVFQIVSVTDNTFTLGAFVTSIAGKQGEAGSGLEILDSFNSESQLPAAGNVGDAYFIGEDLYVWSPSQGAWVNKGQIGSGGGITGLMSPDPRTYFLYILNGGEPGGDGDPSATAQLNFAKLNAMVLA